jgi:uncharacterized coiled-coil DUF342 family protein
MAPKAAAKTEKKLERPDRDVFDKEMLQYQTNIEALQKKQQELTKKIEVKMGGKEEFQRKKDEFTARMDELQNQISTLMGQKDVIYNDIKSTQSKGKDMKSELNSMKKNLGYNSVKEIDDAIADIEYKMWTETLTLKKEKEYIAQISQLKKRKPEFTAYANKEAEVMSFDTSGVGQMRANAADLSEKINALRDERRKVKEGRDKLVEERRKKQGDMPELFDEREGISKQLGANIRERNAKRDEFYTNQREFNAKMMEEKNARWEKQQVERDVKNAEWEKQKLERQAEEGDEDLPFQDDINLVNQVITYCRSLVKGDEEKKEEKKTETKFDNPEGSMVVLGKKKDDGELKLVVKGQKAKKNRDQAATKEKKSTTFKHQLETLHLFGSVKLDPPLSADEVPGLLEKLNQQLSELKEKQDDATKDIREKREEAKKKLAEAAANVEAAKKKLETRNKTDKEASE